MLKRIFTGLVGLLVAGAVQAVPIQFEIDGAGSSVDMSGLSICVGCSVTTSLDPGLGSTSFALEQGDSFSFDFFSLAATGSAGAIGGVVSATLAFTLPTVGSGSGSALAAAGWFNILLGVGGSGGLEFFDQPDDIAFGDGGLFSVSFSGAGDTCKGIGLFPNCTLNDIVTATVTLLQAPGDGGDTPQSAIPEPSTILLLALGLLLIAGTMRRRPRVLAA